MGKGTKDPQKPSKAYLQANPGSSSQIPPEASKAKGKGRATKPSSEGNAEHDLLRQAIKDLGGDDEDFELVKGVDSDAEEVEDAPAKGKQHKSEAVSEACPS
jgi:ribosome biogenesis protein MAK21